MKKFRTILAALLVIACAFSVIPAASAKADVKDTVPKTIRSYTGSSNSAYFSVKGKKTIKSVTTSSKDMIAKITSTGYAKENKEVTENSYTLTTYCEKDGKYTVTLNFSDKSKKDITVYNYPGPKFTVKVNGKEQYLSKTSEKECKVAVDIEKGYSIQKLEYVTYKKEKTENGYSMNEVYKSFKSGAKVPINKTPWSYKSEYKYEYEDYSSESKYTGDSLFAYTEIRITYKDKYTNEKEIAQYSIASVLVP